MTWLNAKSTSCKTFKCICAGFLSMILIVTTIVISTPRINDFIHSTTIHDTNQWNSTENISRKDAKICVVYLNNSGGRLGNRMFIIASAYGLARLHLCYLYVAPEITKELESTFVLDFSPLLISTTQYDTIIHNTSQPMSKSAKSVNCQYFPELTRPNAIPFGHIYELQGYWQSYLHFEQYRDELRNRIFIARNSIVAKVSLLFIKIYKEKFKFKPMLSTQSHHQLKRQLAESSLITWVGIHVRRQDFLHLRFSSSDEYLISAVKYYTKLYPNAHFIVASDDRVYCEKLFRDNRNVSLTPNSFSAGDDMIALSLCEHSVVSGGSFGWWAAYLANGHVIHDKVYPSQCERREYYYPPWFLIDGKVRSHPNNDYTL